MRQRTTDVMRRLIAALACATLVVAAGCSDDDDDDRGSNNGADVGVPDAGPGTDPDAGPDAGPGTDPDAGPDAGPTDGIGLEGLSADVEVSYDEQGVLHLDCQTDADCYAAQGYFHARDRFVQMDVRRRFARGRLTTLIGPPITEQVLAIDRTSRQLFTTRDGQPLEEVFIDNLEPYTLAALEAYTDGVNAWLADLRANEPGADLSAEYDFGFVQATPETIPDWEVADSVATILLLLDQLSNTADTDLRYGEIYAQLPPEVAFDLVGVMSAVPVATMPASGEVYTGITPLIGRWQSIAELDALRRRLQPAKGAMGEARGSLDAREAMKQKLRVGGPTGDRGSNNWVLGPSRTQSGHGILANDPHLSLSQPALWHLSELDSKTNGEGSLHVAGVSFPGLPGVTIGHNEDIAWGATVVYYDLADAYIEELSPSGDGVMLDGVEVPFVERTFEFDVVGQAEPVVETFRYVPHHGPVLSIDEEAGTAVSVRWTGNDAKSDLNLFYDVMRASTVEEARLGFAWSTSANQNWIVLDTNDDIGWFPYAAVPVRPWASLELSPWIPLPGDGSAEWGPPIPYDELPQMTNPDEGFIATANQDATGAKYDGDPTNEHVYLQGHTAIGIREARIVELIEAGGDQHTVETNLAIQGDTYMLLAELVLPEILSVLAAAEAEAALPADVDRLQGALEGWAYTCPTGLDGIRPDAPKESDPTLAAESIGCTVFHYLLAHVADETFGDELAGTGVTGNWDDTWRSLIVMMHRPEFLQNGVVYWDDVRTAEVETPAETILAGVADAAAQIESDLGDEPDDWRWGRVHTVTFRPDLFSQFGSAWDNGPFAAPGGALTVNVANPQEPLTGNFRFTGGPSMRLLAWNDGARIRALMSFPGGNSMFEGSRFYDNLVEGWLNNDPFELLFERDQVEAAAVETFLLQPAP